MNEFIKRQFEFLRRHFKQHIMVLFLIVVVSYYGCWRVFSLEAAANPGLTDYYRSSWSYAPNLYRMYKQFLVLLNGHLFSLFTWMTLFWIISMYVTYLIIKPQSEQLVQFILCVIVLTLLRDVSDAPIYPLIALIVIYRENPLSTLILIPIALVKEIAAWIGLGVLLLYSRNKKEGIITFAIGAATYGFIRFIIIGDVGYPPDATPFFVIPALPEIILESWTYVILQGTIALILLLFILRKDDINILIWNAIPVFLFALFWFPHLWFPVILISLINQIEQKSQEANPLESGKEMDLISR